MKAMADIADAAQAQQERLDALKIQAVRERANAQEVAATGRCLCCGEQMEGRRWCDAECRDEWEKSKR